MTNKKSESKPANGATLGFEQKLWQAADALRNNMDAGRFLRRRPHGHGLCSDCLCS